MKIIIRNILMLVLMTTSAKSFSAEFDVMQYGIIVRGKIEQGDYRRFQDFVLEGENIWQLRSVYLSSPGGDVVESLKFANLFEKSYTETRLIPTKTCDSSCFIMWAGGIGRHLGGMAQLGVHRISLRQVGTDIAKAKGLISPMASDVSNYMSELGIPRALIDKMNETPASSIFRIDDDYIRSQGWYFALAYQPVYLDILEKACGKYPDPYPGVYVVDKPRDSQTMARITDWVECETAIQTKGRIKFFLDELQSLEQGKPTILFMKDKLKEVRRLLNSK